MTRKIIVTPSCFEGVTGKNVTTAIMDDGVDYMHPDLFNNYVRS